MIPTQIPGNAEPQLGIHAAPAELGLGAPRVLP